MIQRTTGRVVTIAVAALLGAFLAAWLVGWSGDADTPVTGKDASEDSGSGAGTSPEAGSTSPPASPSASAAPARRTKATPRPTELRVPSLDLRMPVRALGVDDAGLMALPSTPFEAAWYRYGPRPLDERGATVIAGHVDTRDDGIGPLSQIGALRSGDTVVVRAGREDVTYRVEEVRQVAKQRVDLASLFSRDGPARLHLVTCGGDYLPDAGGYQANVVVVARPVG